MLWILICAGLTVTGVIILAVAIGQSEFGRKLADVQDAERRRRGRG